jgi:hypothetical protein
MSDNEMTAFLEEQRVDWIVIGPHEADIMALDLRQRLTQLDLQSWYRAGDGAYEVLLHTPLTGRTEASAISAVDG